MRKLRHFNFMRVPFLYKYVLQFSESIPEKIFKTVHFREGTNLLCFFNVVNCFAKLMTASLFSIKGEV